MSSQGLDVARIGCQNSAGRLRVRHNERVDGGTASSTSPKQCSTSGERLGQSVRDVASLEKPVFRGISAGVTFQAFHQDNRWHARRPEALLAKSQNESQSLR